MCILHCVNSCNPSPRSWIKYFVLLVALSTCATVTYGSSGEVAKLIFFDDFSDDRIGELPVNWTLNYAERAQVVLDSQMVSGKAVRVVVNEDQERDTHLKGPIWDFGSLNPRTIVGEFQMNWIQGRGINIYLSSSKAHHINLNIDDAGQLHYRHDKLVALESSQLQDGWNRIRLIANNEENEVFIFLNDMNTPIGGPLPFRTPTESWENIYFLVLHARSAVDVGPAPEALYGDFAVWVLDDH